MFIFSVYKSNLWKDDKSRISKIVTIGILFYIILLSVVLPKCDNKYVLYVPFADILFTLIEKYNTGDTHKLVDDKKSTNPESKVHEDSDDIPKYTKTDSDIPLYK